MFHKVISAAPLSGHRILIHFSDGTAKEYNMSDLIAKMDAYSDLGSTPGLFEQVVVDPGGYGLSWNDDIDIDSSELWTNGRIVSTPFDGLLSFSDAATIWNLNESTLRKAISYGKLTAGVDALKFGKQWIVTSEAMTREYGTPN